MLQIQDVRVCNGCTRLRWSPVAMSCEHDNELSGSIKGREFLDHLRVPIYQGPRLVEMVSYAFRIYVSFM